MKHLSPELSGPGSSAPTYDIVVVAENDCYLMWQTMLFHYSCLRYMGVAPIVVVHADEDELLPGFHQIEEHGGRLQRLPSFRRCLGPDYPVMNTVWALRHVQSDADYLVLCDCDMLFLRALPLERFALAEDQVSFDEVQYLIVDSRTKPFLREPCRRAGLSFEQLAGFQGRGGVPHIIPRVLQRPFSEEWLRCMRCFIPEGSTDLPTGFPWVALMWAQVMAALRLSIRPVTTRLCQLNHLGRERLAGADDQDGGPFLVHYCYGDDEFDKRHYHSDAQAERVWQASARPGSLNAAICAHLQQAARFYGTRSDIGRTTPVDRPKPVWTTTL